MELAALAEELEDTGRVWFRNALADVELERFDRICAVENRPGLRLDMTDALLAASGAGSVLQGLISQVLPDACAVRFVAFNKSEEANWLVPWHQDRVVAVAEKHEVEGFSNWSQKSGTWHCEPPVGLLSDMLFARVHLDDSDVDNGCLEIALGTHKRGFIAADMAEKIAQGSIVETCKARRGDVLLVKALTLHRSKSSKTGAPRRTLRVDYSNAALPAPLDWWVED